MTTQEINKTYYRIISFLKNKELKNAFDSIQGLIAGTQEYAFQDKQDELQETYKTMLRYRIKDVKDPMQDKIYNDLQISVYELTDKIKRQLFVKESTQTYYVHLRRSGNLSITSFKDAHKQITNTYETSNFAETENLMQLLFSKVMVSDFLNSDEVTDIRNIITDNNLPHFVGCQIVSALFLGTQIMFDREKIMLLFDAASHTNEEIRVRAYISILVLLYTYRDRINLYESINNRVEALAENTAFVKTVRTITLRFILARETEKIGKKLREELIPEMMKLSPMINKKIDLSEPSSEQWNEEMNPEWKNILEESGINKKIEELNELQHEGADLMHSTFIHLKNFPFFSQINNWFMPFITEFFPTDGDDSAGRMLNLMSLAPFMCNSDKYSLFFSIQKLLPDQQKMMMGQFGGEMGEMIKQEKAEFLKNLDQTDRIAGQYIQDLYRFYKLYPAHSDFDDIFSYPLDFHNLSILAPYLSDKESLTIIAEYYLRKKYFDEALHAFELLAEKQSPSAVLYQKTGYCKQMQGNTAEALKDYLHSDLLEPDSKWVTRRIAASYRTLKQPEDALNYYIRYEKLQPDNLSILTNIGHCYLELKDYSEALKYYFKVDYIDNKGHKTWRPIAWCSFLAGKYDQARNYYIKILNEKPKPSSQDLLNAGHTEWVLQHTKNALDLYNLAVITEERNFDKFKELFLQDKQVLIQAGLEESDLCTMLDEIQYSL
jgi:Tfp pilus assembly protein PilF